MSNLSESNEVNSSGISLSAGYSYMIGNFIVILDEDTQELRVIVHKSKLRMLIKPNSDNSCTIVGSR